MIEERVVLEHEACATLVGGAVGDFLAMELNVAVAFVRELQTSNDAQQRGLATAAGAEQRHHLARADVEVYFLQCFKFAKGLADVLDAYAHAAPRWVVVRVFSNRVIRASSASTEATAKAGTNWYSL